MSYFCLNINICIEYRIMISNKHLLFIFYINDKVLVTQSCPSLCKPMDYSPPGSSVRGILQARTRVGCCGLLQGIFHTETSNPGLPRCRQILRCLSHHGGPTDMWIIIVFYYDFVCLFDVAMSWLGFLNSC